MIFKPSKLKYSKYFLNDVYPRREYLTEELILEALCNKIGEEKQDNDRISIFSYNVKHMKYLRVIVEYSEENEMIIFNAYWDRTYLRKIQRG